MRTDYGSKEFINEYYYSGNDLGAVCTPEGTCFKIWSPFAEEVILNLYMEGSGTASFERRSLKKGRQGVWETAFGEDLHGIYYDYDIKHESGWVRTADPYAKACGINGMRSMAVQPGLTDPQGWRDDRSPARGTEDIIYEVHVKEFSWDESGGFPEEYRGKYKAFTCTDTTLHGMGVYPTGIRYLKELGITHVQLMPVFDYGSVDESSGQGFNWGYDPVNYNVPEGSYSMNPAKGDVRITELKELVKSLHENGFRVVMDVVYNHTYRADSWLERTVPGYYYRHMADGSLSDGSGCGNDIASERAMCGKYILDSVMYWTEEYHIDGFRFDLMGLLNVELMNSIQSELDKRYGAGEKLIYGEPWAAAGSPMEDNAVPALNKNVRELDMNIGVFCDNTRDAVKGHVFEREIPGFVNGGTGLEENILMAAGAWCKNRSGLAKGFRPKAPSQVITYVSAHDNLTLWDKLVETVKNEDDRLRACRLAAAVCFTCQGRLFMLSGEEFARTKDGNENSFDAPISLNRLYWNRTYEKRELVEYYRGLIELRKNLPGICDKSSRAPARLTGEKTEAPGCVSFLADNTISDGVAGKESRWSRLFIVYNASGSTQKILLPGGTWQVLLLSEDSWLWKKSGMTVQKELILEGISAAVLGKV